MAKYIANSSGRLKEVQPISSSAGGGDASKMVQTDGTGKLDISFMPVGVGAEVTVCPAFEALTAGDFINLFLSGGVIKAQKADATTNAKPAHGFVLSNVLITDPATVFGISNKNTVVAAALTIGTDYWLSTTPGILTATSPSATGNIVQWIGRAETTAAIILSNVTYYELI
jgi:hypothetical protein